MLRAITSLALVWLGMGCDRGLPPTPQEPLNFLETSPASDCAKCHPRQFREWVGSSHNYGGGLDPGYQSLEITANYNAVARGRGPTFRRAVLCVQCHAPTAGAIVDGKLNPNASFRDPEEGTVTREIRYPTDDTDPLLEPPGRASEGQINDQLDETELLTRRRVTFQGITCDSCHKVGAPFDDLTDEEAGQACKENTPECAKLLREQCEEKDDPRCRRIARAQNPEGADYFDRGIANVAIRYDRDTTTRFGPFAPGDVAENVAHGVLHGADPGAQNYNAAFSGQPDDIRPFIKTGQFCGACHDVRLPVDNPATPQVELEPIHGEPFVRLENLFTEWFRSPLNLHPDSDPRDDPYLDDAGNPRRLVCQDCHMSLFPFAPPGTFPGSYTASDTDCDPTGLCGSVIALSEADGKPTTRSNLRVRQRPRVTTHNMTGVDIGIGYLEPQSELLGYGSNSDFPDELKLPSQKEANAPAQDLDYGLPVSLDQRRKQQMENAVTMSLAGTPEIFDLADRDCSDGFCCDDAGECNFPVKVWMMNINGGHNVAAGFSQERQVWAEVTVQDFGAPGQPVVDCPLGGLDDLYTDEDLADGRYPRWTPKPHDALEATDVVDRFYGEGDHHEICRGISGHLMDKPHDETNEPMSDGRTSDEDIFLHRIGNTLPELEDGRYLISWHVLDLGHDPNNPATPDFDRVARDDQFHVPGNDPFACELSGREWNTKFVDMPVTVFDPVTRATEVLPLSSLPPLKHGVTQTPDERQEILYPFPEYKPLLPKIENGVLEPGERFGLAYATNIFYRICGCPLGEGRECEGPKQIPAELSDSPAQVPWIMTYPTLPSADEATRPAFEFAGDRANYTQLLDYLGMPAGTTAAEAFTFVPLNSNHMPNNRSLKFYQPQRHYFDIRVDTTKVVGPIRVAVKVWYRHFPPEFLRLMSRVSKQAYARADALGKTQELFPNGPLIVEGPEDSARFPHSGNIDNLYRFVLDEAVKFVALNPQQGASNEYTAVPERPTWDRDVRWVVKDNCLPCHSDVLRHGRLVMSYDDFPQWDDPLIGEKKHAAQDPLANLVGAPSELAPGETLVIPGNSESSFLWKVVNEDNPHARVRRMPLKFDKLSARELEIIKRWIDTGASRN